MKHIISTIVLQNIINYLANRPYSEVAELIKQLQEDVKMLEQEADSE